MIIAPKTVKNPKIERVSIKSWIKGFMSERDDGRTPSDGLRGATNVILSQDGTVGPRRGLRRYGPPALGTYLGEIAEFTRLESGVPQNYLVSMQDVGGVAEVYYAKDENAWTKAAGKTYDETVKAHFLPIRDDAGDKVLVMNGQDNLSYLDIDTLAVVPFTQLTTPTGVSVNEGAGITGSTFDYRYRVSAGNRGETAASTAEIASVDTIREEWTTSTDYVDVTFDRVPNAERYHIYVGVAAGQEEYVTSVDDPGTGTDVTFRDTGSITPDLNRVAPEGDTTIGPVVTRGAFINGQIFLVGDKDNPKYVRFGGTGASVLDFSPFGGGGFQPIGGNKEFPVRVISYRTGQGVPAINVLCQGTNGLGQRYLMESQTLEINGVPVPFFSVKEDNGEAGTDSPDGVVNYNDNIYYPSRDGFKSTGTLPQVQNILSTRNASNTIEKSVEELNTKNMGNSVGLAHEGRLYWAVPFGSETNSQIWTLDLRRDGAWMLPMSIAADWMLLYNSNDGVTHHLVVQDNELYEFAESQATNDNGTAFNTNVASGIIKFSEDGADWAAVLDVSFVLLRPQGRISLSVSGKTEEASLATVGADEFTQDSTVSGWSETGWSEYWGADDVAPISFGDSRVVKALEIDEELNWIKWDLTTVDAGVDYELSDVVIRYVNIGTRDLT